MDPPGLLERLFSLLQPLVVRQNVLLDLMLALNQLVLGRDVLPCELGEVYMPVLILIELLVDLIDDLAAMLIINAFLGQVVVHLVAVHPAIAVPIQLAECLPQTNLFVRALLLLSVHVQLSLDLTDYLLLFAMRSMLVRSSKSIVRVRLFETYN